MTATLRASKFRLVAGAVLAAAGLLIAVFLLPDASQKRHKTEQALKDAVSAYARQIGEFQAIKAEAKRLEDDRKAMDDLMKNLPAEGLGRLQWTLSEKLFELSKKHGVRLVAVKYGATAKEASKASLLESVDVEFSVTGLYQNLKPFMLALEGSKLPFAVVGAKLEESPEGAHLTCTLRAFRQIQGAAEPQGGEGA
jgi:Tfp pilus assembly protein PilO